MSDHSAIQAAAKEPTIQVTPAPYVRIPLAAVMFGLTDKAIRRKIEEGKWVEGREYKRSPDGGIYISVRGVTRWIEGQA